MDEASALPFESNVVPFPTPAGLDSLYSLCKKIYPNQDNPLQVTALVKYWLGGPDPLDYVSMYSNPGIPQEKIPPHWHYISFGLSDLHGDGRVHDTSDPSGVSGFGFELTFRLKKEADETVPPTWPAALMQSLAKYVFQSGNLLCSGDHVSWHCALDNSESRIQHILITSDVQLQSAHTPFGSVDFIQIVGVCPEELKAAQQWNGSGILDMLKKLPSAGGAWHITDMRRGESVFDLNVNASEEVERGFELEGSNLSGVSARCSWAKHQTEMSLSGNESGYPNHTINVGCDRSQTIPERASPNCLEPSNGCGFSIDPKYDITRISESHEIMQLKKLDSIHLIFNLEAGSLLPLAIRGRVKHGRHFTFKSVLGDTAITLVASSVTGTLVNLEHPYVAQGSWLQVLITDDLAQDMADTFHILSSPETLLLPKTFAWPRSKLYITLISDKI